jgi:hypothetical protein
VSRLSITTTKSTAAVCASPAATRIARMASPGRLDLKKWTQSPIGDVKTISQINHLGKEMSFRRESS